MPLLLNKDNIQRHLNNAHNAVVGDLRFLHGNESGYIFPFRWEDFPKMSSARGWPGVEWVPDGRLFAMGGFSGDHQPTKSVEMLKCSWTSNAPPTTTWRDVAPMLEPRAKHGVGYFAEKLFVAGGRDSDTVEYFTLPSAGTPNGEWTTVRPLNMKTAFYGLLPFGDGLLCVGKSRTFSKCGASSIGQSRQHK